MIEAPIVEGSTRDAEGKTERVRPSFFYSAQPTDQPGTCGRSSGTYRQLISYLIALV
jgi:hypothetical protein